MHTEILKSKFQNDHCFSVFEPVSKTLAKKMFNSFKSFQTKLRVEIHGFKILNIVCFKQPVWEIKIRFYEIINFIITLSLSVRVCVCVCVCVLEALGFILQNLILDLKLRL